MNDKYLVQQRNSDGCGGAVHFPLSPAQIFFPGAFIFNRMLWMQNKYEMFRAAVYAVTNLSSVKLIILPNSSTGEVIDLYFSLHGTSQTRNVVNGC